MKTATIPVWSKTDEYKGMIRKLAKMLQDHWPLCEFAGKTEAEVLLWQTLHASKINLDRIGIPCSFEGEGMRASSGGGLWEGSAGFRILTDRRWVDEVPVSIDDIDAPKNVAIEDGMVNTLWIRPACLDAMFGHIRKKARD